MWLLNVLMWSEELEECFAIEEIIQQSFTSVNLDQVLKLMQIDKEWMLDHFFIPEL